MLIISDVDDLSFIGNCIQWLLPVNSVSTVQIFRIDSTYGASEIY